MSLSVVCPSKVNNLLSIRWCAVNRRCHGDSYPANVVSAMCEGGRKTKVRDTRQQNATNLRKQKDQQQKYKGRKSKFDIRRHWNEQFFALKIGQVSSCSCVLLNVFLLFLSLMLCLLGMQSYKPNISGLYNLHLGLLFYGNILVMRQVRFQVYTSLFQLTNRNNFFTWNCV